LRLLRLAEVEKDDDRRIADGSESAGKCKGTGLSIHAESGDRVGSLIAGIEEVPGRIEIEAAGIVAARPLFADEGQRSRFTD